MCNLHSRHHVLLCSSAPPCIFVLSAKVHFALKFKVHQEVNFCTCSKSAPCLLAAIVFNCTCAIATKFAQVHFVPSVGVHLVHPQKVQPQHSCRNVAKVAKVHDSEKCSGARRAHHKSAKRCTSTALYIESACKVDFCSRDDVHSNRGEAARPRGSVRSLAHRKAQKCRLEVNFVN